ncbi:MAG: hypothetical protein J4F99_04600, partial [Acidimicrobiia bacterium]|nr:hypothetical protein [Acidimicrobiia bacterium]
MAIVALLVLLVACASEPPVSESSAVSRDLSPTDSVKQSASDGSTEPETATPPPQRDSVVVSTEAPGTQPESPTGAGSQVTEGYTAITARYEHTCALGADQTLTCWGANGSGQASPPDGTYTAVTAGGYHTCAIGTD